jgi:hypothetical protein
MWSIVAGVSTVIGSILGILTATNPKLIEPPWKYWFIGAFVLVATVGVVSALMDQRESTKQAEDALRQVTGRGGFPTLIVQGLSPIEGQIKDGLVFARFMVLNSSKVPVFDSRVQITQFVGAPNGFMGSDSLLLPTASVASVYPHDAPKPLFMMPVLSLDKPNIFTAVVFSRSATFTQKVVILWKGDAWHTDTEVIQQEDADRDTEGKVFKKMSPEFQAFLPEAWRTAE